MSTSPATLRCPYCPDHPPLVSDGAQLAAVHCPVCCASALPAASATQLVVNGLGMRLEVFGQLVQRGTPGPFACVACGQQARVVTLRFRPVHVCAACGTTMVPGGTLHFLTAGRFGKPAPVAAGPAAPEPVAAPPSSTPFSRLLSTMAYAVGARKLVYMALSAVFFAIVASIWSSGIKPVKIGKDGLPEGNLGMRPESAEAFRSAIGQFGPPATGGGCPEGASFYPTATGMECRKPDGARHGPASEDTCDDEGNGFVREGTWADGKKHGRFVEKTCEGELRSEGMFVAGEPDGEQVERWPNGSVKRRQNFKSGKLHGAYFEGHENGRPAIEGFFHEGAKAGVWIHTGSDGRVIREERM